MSWKTMGGGQYTSDRMNELVGKQYGDMMNKKHNKLFHQVTQ